MSAAVEIDPLRFARAGERLDGECAVVALGRIADLLASDRGVVRYRLGGAVASGRPTLVVRVEAELDVVCQRCLGACALRVESESHLLLARDEDEVRRWEHEDPALEVLLAEPVLDVLALVEDELLLSLPLVPRHADGECGPPTR